MVTVFTPVYNRAYIINDLYQSLQRQTNKEFEWIIIDDGSQDNIIELVNKWIERDHNEFAIRFYSVDNGGKHRAINKAVKIAQGDAFFIVDSDDYITDDAIEWINVKWRNIQDDEGFAGIAGLKMLKNGKLTGFGKLTFKEYVDATNLEREKYNLDGDKAEVYKTELLREFPFPEYENEKFVTEAVVWNKIAYEGYKIRWFNKVIYMCDYLEDGLTAKGKQLFIDNPNGWAHYMRMEREYRRVDEGQYFRNCYHFYECEYMRFTDDEINEMLGLKERECELVLGQYKKFLQTLNKLCADKRVCIYAYGRWGKELKKYLDRLEVQVNYVIDKQYEQIKAINAYSIDMDLPQTDIVFIALKDGAEKVAEAIRKKMPETEIVLYRDIKPYL